MKTINRKTFDVPEKGTRIIELREVCPGGWSIVGIMPDGSETRLGAYTVWYHADEDFRSVVEEYSDYLTDEVNTHTDEK